MESINNGPGNELFRSVIIANEGLSVQLTLPYTNSIRPEKKPQDRNRKNLGLVSVGPAYSIY